MNLQLVHHASAREMIATAADVVARRLADRLDQSAAGHGVDAASFLVDHRRAIRDRAGHAVRRACLAVEAAFRVAVLRPTLASLAPREPSALILRQFDDLRAAFLRAVTSRGDLRVPANVADCLADARRAGAFDPPHDETRDAIDFEPAAPNQLAELFELQSHYDEPLLIALGDYFLARALEADPVLGGPFVFLHLDRPDDLWADELGAVARVVETSSQTLEDLLDRDLDRKVEPPSASDSDDAELERLFQEGLDRYLGAEYERAVPLFTAALRLDPENVSLFAYRGDAHRLLCDYDHALADYSAALRLHPASAPLLAQRAATYLLRGDLDRALADANAALALDSEHVPALMCRADTYLERAAYEPALADYTAVIALQPRNMWGYFGRGKAALRNQAYAAAIADFSQVLALNPHHVVAQLQRGDACRFKGDFTEAIVDYTEVARQHPRNALAYRGRALARQAKGDCDGAIADFSLALRVDANDAASYRCRGALYRRKGELERALTDLDEAIRRADGDAVALCQRGLLFLARGQLAEALADFDDAIAVDASALTAYLGRAVVHDRLGKFADGIQSCGRALRLDEECAAAYLIRGMIGSHAGHHAQASADLSRAIALDADFPYPYEERALVARLSGDLDQAVDDYTKVIALLPGHAAAYANRGVVHQLRGAHELAMADFALALRLDPQCIHAGWHQGLTEGVRDRTTKLLADYIDGIRPPLPEAAPAPLAVAARKQRRTAVRLPGAETTEFAVPEQIPTQAERDDSTSARGAATDRRRRPRPQADHGSDAASAIGDLHPSVALATKDATTPGTPTDAAPNDDPEKAVDDTAADLLLTMTDSETPAPEPAQPAPAPAAPPTLPPLRCPMCRATATPKERLDGGRVRCGSCDAVFFPTASSFAVAPTPAPANRSAAAAKLPKPKSSKATDDDEPRYTGRQKAIMTAAAASLLFIAWYFFFPSGGGGGGDGPPIAASVSAEEILRDFSVNRTNAAKKYTIGHVVVTGEVAEVFADKRPRVRFKCPERTKVFVEAVFGHIDDMKDIKKSDRITIRGECDGWTKNILEITLCKVVPRESVVASAAAQP